MGAAPRVHLASRENIWQCNPWMLVVYLKNRVQGGLSTHFFMLSQFRGRLTKGEISDHKQNPAHFSLSDNPFNAIFIAFDDSSAIPTLGIFWLFRSHHVIV